MEKKKITRQTKRVSLKKYHSCNIPELNEFIEELVNIRDENSRNVGRISVDIDKEWDYGDEIVFLEIYCYRQETDEEVDERMKQEEKSKELRREQYEKLKKEFEG